MARRPPDPLRRRGCLHPHAGQVTDELFADHEFFDPRDLVQVKYEMLRRVRVDGDAVSRSAARFGLSRPAYYQARQAYEAGGLPALLPRKPGPAGRPQTVRRRAASRARGARGRPRAPGATVGAARQGALRRDRSSAQHRAGLIAAGKKTPGIRPPTTGPLGAPPAADHATQYEALRQRALERLPPLTRHGLAVLLRLVGEVGMGRAGIVLGLEVSRLARNSSDWHRLLEICAVTDTLLLDEDGVYSPSDFNDRLLLGLKGTMSEAELHVLRARLRGGILNQARRGALRLPLPVGLVYDPVGTVVLDPDGQVQRSLALLFATFERAGSASATVKHFRTQGVRFPRRPRRGPQQGELLWEPLRHWRVLHVLHNPRYAGAFGRTRTHQRPGRRVAIETLPRDEWTVRLPDAHVGYITWDQFERNQQRLRDNAYAHGAHRRRSPPREGPALLQGLVLCGVCGQRMTVRYHTRQGTQWSD